MQQSQDNRFQIGEYWLSQRKERSSWCRTWYDNATRQTCRVSLGTDDFEQAKQVLLNWYYLNETTQPEKTDQQSLAQLFGLFYENHGRKLSSSDVCRRALQCWLEFFEEQTVAEACKIQRQELFQEWLLNDKNLSNGTAVRFIGVGKAALNWSWKRELIESVPYVPSMPKKAAAPRGRPLTTAELETLLQHVKHQHVLDFIWLMLATGSRPDAIYDLTLSQCDLENRLIHLNPDGREQTKKHRPSVKMPEQLVPLIERRIRENDCPNVIAYKGKPVKSVKKAWRQLREEAGLGDQVNPYSLRHTMARWLRSQSVPAWEVAAQLGHKKRDMSTTEIYAPYDPAYLSQSVVAIDVLLQKLNSALVVNSTKVACAQRVQNAHATGKRSLVKPLIDKDKMVGVRRIELRTSSMSRIRKHRNLQKLHSLVSKKKLTRS